MGQVIVASVRLPVSMTRQADGSWRAEQSPGGLVSALRPVLKERKNIWLGWPGTVVDVAEQSAVEKALKAHGASPLFLSEEELEGFYEGFSNGVLWPLLHGLPSRARFVRREWEVYRRVNERFADAIKEVVGPGDVVWVHDYQLALVPEMLRARGVHCAVGYFLHVPFPSAEIYRSLPARAEILSGLLGADLIGFHDYSYVRHFRSACLRVLGLESEAESLRHRSRTVSFGVLPIGIDPDEIDRMREGEVANAELAQLTESYAGKKLVVGVDRLDYTKGIPEKLLAFEELLTNHPQWRERVVLVQVAAPSRTGVEEYQQLKRELDELVGRINGAFGTPSYTPIVYVNQNVPRERLVGLYAAADVALVTPVRDGMNLVALEYVAARGDHPGTLVLSEFTGAAHSMAGAKLVNPHDPQAVSDTLHEALSAKAPSEESFRHMRAFVRHNTAEFWAKRFLALLESLCEVSSVSSQVLRLDEPPLAAKVNAAQSPLILLDYDGTLRRFEKEPDAASPEPRTLAVLERLAKLGTVYIVSGRFSQTLEEWLGHLPIGLVGEHGLGEKHSGENWVFHDLDPEQLFQHIEPLMQDFVERTPGSSLEKKRAGLAWHYRAVEPEFGMLRAMDLITSLESQIHRQPLNILRGNRVVEVRHEGVSKGRALERLLQRYPESDFVFCAGDDRTDEEMMQAVPAAWLERTVRAWVGWRNPLAEYWVDSPSSLVGQLEVLATMWEKRG